MLDGVTGTSDDSQPGGSPPGSMRTALVLVVVGSCLVVSVATVRAIDQPVDAVKLAMKRSATAAKLVLVSRDPDFAFPPLGSAGTIPPSGARAALGGHSCPAGTVCRITGPDASPASRCRRPRQDVRHEANLTRRTT
jgi:hypothetical protein